MSGHSVDDWLAVLEGVSVSSSGWKALCPAHNDRVASLSISPSDDDGAALIYCFAGCDYRSIEKAAFHSSRSAPRSSPVTFSRTVEPEIDEDSEARQAAVRGWWRSYTRIDLDEWEEWGVQFDGGFVEFTWPRVSSVKGRAPQSHNFFWEPESGVRPALWPLPENVLPSTIWITEGETDAGVLRHLGLPAFATTKGASSIAPLEGLWRQLKSRGVETVVVVGDLDPAGQKFQSSLCDQIRRSTLHTATVDLRDAADLLLGEKDLRDIWRSGRWREDDLRRHLETNLVPDIHPNGADFRFEVTNLLSQPEQEMSWLCRDILPSGGVSMLVGEPKRGKSWLALDLCLSISSGTPFLASFPISSAGPTVYLTKEDTPTSLKSRVAKILVSKGFGGSIEEGEGYLRAAFPKKTPHECWIALQRGFYLTPEAVKELIDWLKPIGPKLIVLDPILRMIWEADEFKAGEVAKSIFDPLTTISRELGCAVMFVHHKSKGGGAKGSYGSIAFHAFVDSALYLTEPGETLDDWTEVYSEFKAAESAKWSYRLRDLKDGYSPSVLRGDEVEESIRDRILQVLDEVGGSIRISLLRESLKISSESLRLYIDALVSEGLVEELGTKLRKID